MNRDLDLIDPVGVMPVAARGRIDAFLSEIAQRTTESDFGSLMQVMRDAVRADFSERIPDPDNPQRWQYARMPDHPVRLGAVKLWLSYLAGLPPSQQDIRVTRTNDSVGEPVAIDQQVAELRQIGLTLEDLSRHLERKAAKSVSH